MVPKYHEYSVNVTYYRYITARDTHPFEMEGRKTLCKDTNRNSFSGIEYSSELRKKTLKIQVFSLTINILYYIKTIRIQTYTTIFLYPPPTHK